MNRLDEHVGVTQRRLSRLLRMRLAAQIRSVPGMELTCSLRARGGPYSDNDGEVTRVLGYQGRVLWAREWLAIDQTLPLHKLLPDPEGWDRDVRILLWAGAPLPAAARDTVLIQLLPKRIGAPPGEPSGYSVPARAPLSRRLAPSGVFVWGAPRG